VSVNQDLFQQVYVSKYRKVKIFKVLKVSKKSKVCSHCTGTVWKVYGHCTDTVLTRADTVRTLH
jgi:hypothetical protein